MVADPVGDIGDDGWIDILGGSVLERGGRTGSGEELVVVGLVDPDGDVVAVTEAVLPAGEVVGDGDLIVASPCRISMGMSSFAAVATGS